MYTLITIFVVVPIVFYFIQRGYQIKSENFDIKRQIFDYQFPMNRMVYKDLCPIQGTIEQIDNPNIDSCFNTFYIPYLFNVGNYVSTVEPFF